MSKSYSIGVDFGGTNLRIASYAEGIDFLDAVAISTRLADGRKQVVRDMREAIRALASKTYGGRRLEGIAVGTPGPLELPESMLRNPLIFQDGTDSTCAKP
jgi:glucokinase